MARWLKVEFRQYSHEGGFLILVDLLSGIGVGVDGGGVGVWLSLVWGESGRHIVGGGVVLISMPVLVGVVGGVVSFPGVRGDIGDGLLGDWGGVMVSSGDGVVGGWVVGGFSDVVVSSQGEDGGR